MDPMLQIEQNYKTDQSIANYETYAFNPISGTNLNNPGSITIMVQNSDCFYHPSRSWLQIEGIMKSTGTAYTEKMNVALTNNGVMYLFDNIKYLLSSAEVESVFNPGHATTMMGLAKYSSAYTGLSHCWAPDTNDTADTTNIGFKQRWELLIDSKPDPVGSFRFAVPLDHIFGFAEDYRKVVYGFQHTLVLARSSSDHNALFHAQKDTTPDVADIADGKIELTNIRWMLPRCSPSDVARFELFKQIQSEITLDVGFRMRQCISTTLNTSNQFTWRLGVRSSPEQPRFIFLAFQKARTTQLKNAAAFDNVGLTSAHVLLNGDRYPLNDFTLDYTKNQFDTVYQDFASFNQKFYGVDKMIAMTSVDLNSYKAIYPILMFDVSKQSERLKSGVTDITVQCTFAAAQDSTVICHALMISDRKLRFKSDGNKMVVLF